MTKRVLIATIIGSLLGIFCIIGISLRLGFSGNELFILSTWINRVVMGFVVGLAGGFMFKKTKKINNRKIINKKQIFKQDIKSSKRIYNLYPESNLVYLRGAIIGLIISGSFYIATSFKDLTGFFAGIVYGIIIDYIATKYE